MVTAAEIMESALARGLTEHQASQEAVDAIVAALPRIIDEGGKGIVAQLRHSAPRMLTSHRRMRSRFESRLEAV